MTVNISAKPLTVTIAGQNWSDWVESVKIDYQPYTMGSGLMPCTGTINLIFPANYAGIPSSPIYRFNPSVWQRGAIATILFNGSVLPCGSLFILKPVQPPTKEISGIARMSVSVGCRLALEYYPPEPNDDFADITPNTAKARSSIIQSVLTTIGLSSFSLSIPEYPINYPLPKLEGNWLDFCGKLADSAGYYLRQNSAGAIATERILDNGTTSISYTIGNDEQFWEPIGDVSDQPVEKLTVSGVKYTLETPDVTDTLHYVEYALQGAVLPDFSNSTTAQNNQKIKEITKSVTRSSVSTFTSAINLLITEIETIRELQGIAMPDFSNSTTALNFVRARENKIEKFFTNGVLSRQTDTKSALQGIVMPDFSDNTTANNFRVYEIITTDISKVGDKFKQTITTRQLNGIADPDNSNSTTANNMVELKSIEQQTQELIEQPAQTSQFNLKEEPIKAIVTARQIANDPYRPRERIIDLPFATSIEQLSKYGELFNKVLTGRAFGQRFVGAVNLALLPMQTLVVIDGAIGYQLVTDSLSFAFTQTQALMAFDGIETAYFGVATPSVLISNISFPLAPDPIILIANWQILNDSFVPNPVILEADWSVLQREIYGLIRLEMDWFAVLSEESTLDDGLLAYWKLDEVGGSGVDRVAAFGAYDFDDLGSFVEDATGKIGLGVKFPAMTATGITTITDPITAMTIAFWFKIPSDLSGETGLCSFLSFSAYPADSEDDPEGVKFYMASSGTPLPQDETTILFDRNEYYLFIASSSSMSSDVSLYINNVLLDVGAFTNSPPPITDAIFGGGVQTIDEVGLWNRALTFDERNELYNLGSGKTYPF